ncbi:MFS transporter [Pseudothermotoga sp.]|nr:MFS transporter [Pseudothermotoga sp.]MCX7812204.1 MFS transporter [Pseudothermotoga sp.]MDW8139274.1 MFS transporter [Pseudothermotoga sp.]
MTRSKLVPLLVEFLVYALLACMTLLSQYFVHIDLPPSFVGILMALPSINALWANQLYFLMTYKTNLKRVVFLSTVAGIVSLWLLFISRNPLPIFVFCFLLMLSQGGLVPLLESSLIELASRSNFPYGKIRLFGTLGYAITAFFAGSFMSKNFIVLFVVYSILFFLTEFTVQKSELSIEFHRRPSVHTIDKRFFVLFLIVTLSVGFNLFNTVFLPVLVRSKRFHPTSVGLSLSLMALSELPFLLLADRVVKKVGELKLLFSAIFVVGLRLALASMVKNESQLILIQLLHGWTYIVIYYTTLFLMRKNLSVQTLQSMQIVFWTSLQGIGPLMGSSIGGLVIENLGAETTYLIFGVFAMSLTSFGWYFKKTLSETGG